MESSLITLALVILPAILAGCAGGGGGGSSSGGGSPSGGEDSSENSFQSSSGGGSPSGGGSSSGGGSPSGGSENPIEAVKHAVGKKVSDTIKALCVTATNETFSLMRSKLIQEAEKFCIDAAAKALKLGQLEAAKEAAYRKYMAKKALAEEHRSAAEKAKEAYRTIKHSSDHPDLPGNDASADEAEARRLSTSRRLPGPPPPACVELQSEKLDEVLATEKDDLTVGCQKLYADITLADFLQDRMDVHASRMQKLNEQFMEDFQKRLHEKMKEAIKANLTGEGNTTNNTEAVDDSMLSPTERLRKIEKNLAKIVRNSTAVALDNGA